MTLLKMIESESAEDLEKQTNDFVQHSGKVHVVVNMRIYQGKTNWVNCIIYKEKYDKEPAE